MKRSLFWLFLAGFVLWILFVLASFFAVQKPFSVVEAAAMGRGLLDLLVAGWVGLVGFGLGIWLLSVLIREPLSVAETMILGTGTGLGLLGLLVLLLGLAGLFQPLLAYVITATLTLVAGWRLLGLYRRGGLSPCKPTHLPAGALVYLLIFAAFTLLVALLPPTDFDGLLYHLVAPKLYLQAGGIIGGIDNLQSNFPALMEMLYAWAMLLRGDIAAKLLHSLYGLLTGGLVFVSADRLFNRRTAWLALLIFASMPMIQTLAGWAYNDLALAFYQLAGIYALVNYLLRMGDQSPPAVKAEDKRAAIGWLLLAGFFTGLAMGLKYTSIVMPIAIGLVLIIYSVKRGRWWSGLIDLLTYGVVAGLVGLPWYLKNWWIIGNPVYPFLYEWFGGDFWSQFRADWYAAAGSGTGWDPVELLLLPWLATLGINDANYWDGRLGPLFLLFLPLLILFAIWGGRLRSVSWPVSYYSLGGYALVLIGFWAVGIIWSQSLWQSRLLLPALVILSPLVGWTWASLDRFDLSQFAISRFVTLAIGLTLALILFDIGLLTLRTDPLPYLFGQETRDQYLLRRLGAHYAAMQEINKQLPPEAVIQFLWEPRTYYCERDCRPDNVLDVLAHAAYMHGTAGGITQAWEQAGITHVLIHRTGLQFVLNETPEAVNEALLAEIENEHLQKLIDVAGAYQVYELR